MHPLLEDGCPVEDKPKKCPVEDKSKRCAVEDKSEGGTAEDKSKGCAADKKSEKLIKCAFIGISNWALDPAKMNRGIFIQVGSPADNELEHIAR